MGAVAAGGGQGLAAVGTFAKKSPVQRIQGHYYHADQGHVCAQGNVVVAVEELQTHDKPVYNKDRQGQKPEPEKNFIRDSLRPPFISDFRKYKGRS